MILTTYLYKINNFDKMREQKNLSQSLNIL